MKKLYMMKKIHLILLAILFTSIGTNAQDLSLYFHSGYIGEGDTILKFGDAGAGEIVLDHLRVRNNTEKAMDILVSRERLDMQEGASSQFCWGLCFPPATEVAPESLRIFANESSTDEDFSAHYLPNFVMGESYIKYTFYNANNQFANVSVVIKFLATPAGIAEEAMIGGIVSELYPNPATSFIAFDYQFTPKVKEASVKVFNLMGAEVKGTSLDNNGSKMRMDVSDLNNGIYFYTIYINGDAYKTRKLVVQK